ncbi:MULTISPECIES: transcription initiation factor IIE subunit alpha family protein [unclassified Methanopyrus]|uniref:hypothetical protein n=1 Tax=Methanopyrus sp. SNP6 TaxID=1937005 RepID=UPI00143A5BF9|nr:hypothetical protein [Methanopyrus sp. SNP6]
MYADLGEEDLEVLRDVTLSLLDSEKGVDPEVAKRTVDVILKREAIDEEIAEELGVDPREVRKVLYKLHERGVATFRKERREEYRYPVYSWRLNLREVLRMCLEERRRELEEVERALSNDMSHPVFHCGNDDCPRMSFEEAMEHEFRCPKCGELLEEVDLTEERRELERLAEELKVEIRRLEELRERLG